MAVTLATELSGGVNDRLYRNRESLSNEGYWMIKHLAVVRGRCSGLIDISIKEKRSIAAKILLEPISAVRRTWIFMNNRKNSFKQFNKTPATWPYKVTFIGMDVVSVFKTLYKKNFFDVIIDLI